MLAVFVDRERSAVFWLCGACAVAATVTAVFYYFLCQPPSLLQLGTLARIKTVAGFYHDPSLKLEPAETVIVLGDSMALAGFNANEFDRLAGGARCVYDVGVSGKSQFELLFDLSEPRLAGTHAILFISPGLFDSRTLDIQQRKLDCYKLFGCQIDRQLLDGLKQYFPAVKVRCAARPQASFRWSTNWRILESWRWTFRKNSADPRARLQAQNWLGPYSSDIKHATWEGVATSRDLDQALLSLRTHEPALFAGDLQATTTQRECLRRIIGELQQRCADVTIVIPPLHPRLQAALNPSLAQQFAPVLAQLDPANTRVLDLSGTLQAEEFRDLMHVGNIAATKLTARIYELTSAPGEAR